jgi:transcriptional regulator GlxA family with amidase domain
MVTHRRYPKIPGFRLGIYVFKDAEIVDYAAPYGVFSVARRFDPELDAFLIADAMRLVQTQAGFTVLPNYSFSDRPDMNAFLIPGGFGTRQEPCRELHIFLADVPPPRAAARAGIMKGIRNAVSEDNTDRRCG